MEQPNIPIISTILNNKYFKEYINKIDNWALCDTFCSAIKIVEKYEEKYFKEAVKIYVDYHQKTKKFLQKNNLNKFTHNKAISKIHDSYRVSNEEKKYLNTLRKK